jgi:hypothetical protein
MDFWYHMYGSSVGILRIWILPNGTVNPIPLWELQNNQGNQWKQGRIALPKQTGTFMVRKEETSSVTLMWYRSILSDFKVVSVSSQSL